MFIDSSEGFERLLAADEAASLLSIHPVTLLGWARSGRIPSIRLGRRVAFRISTLNRWVESQQAVRAA
jgi:excisionase family DNA binding protein